MTENRSSYKSIVKSTALYGGVKFVEVLIIIIRTKIVVAILGPEGNKITDNRIKLIETKLNNIPRRKLRYLTPNEKFKQIINKDSVAFAS